MDQKKKKRKRYSLWSEQQSKLCLLLQFVSHLEKKKVGVLFLEFKLTQTGKLNQMNQIHPDGLIIREFLQNEVASILSEAPDKEMLVTDLKAALVGFHIILFFSFLFSFLFFSFLFFSFKTKKVLPFPSYFDIFLGSLPPL